jgi:hypothetical protein
MNRISQNKEREMHAHVAAKIGGNVHGKFQRFCLHCRQEQGHLKNASSGVRLSVNKTEDRSISGGIMDNLLNCPRLLRIHVILFSECM